MIDTTQLNNDEINFLVYLCNTSKNRLVPIVTTENLSFQNRTFVENLLNYLLDTRDDEGLTDEGVKLIQGILDKWTE